VYAVPHQLVTASQQLSSNENNRGCAVTDLLVLLLRQLDQNFSGRVLNIEEAEDCGAVIRNRDILVRVSNAANDSKRQGRQQLTPMSSTIILSRPLGPKELFTTFAMACVAETAQ
jgi:hypothetical protein